MSTGEAVETDGSLALRRIASAMRSGGVGARLDPTVGLGARLAMFVNVDAKPEGGACAARKGMSVNVDANPGGGAKPGEGRGGAASPGLTVNCQRGGAGGGSDSLWCRSYDNSSTRHTSSYDCFIIIMRTDRPGMIRGGRVREAHSRLCHSI